MINRECASNITDSINNRINDRNIPSQMLQPYLSVRPVMTKYSIMPIIDPRKHISVPMDNYPTYNPEQTFNPGTYQAPWSGYASNINKESELKNQIFALQKCSQSVYVPSSNSDLYEFRFRSIKNEHVIQPFPNLFKNEHFSQFNPKPENTQEVLFNNPTRQQRENF